MIKLKNISKKFTYTGEQSVQALDNVSMSFDKGEFVVLLGENGSGKSTLFNIISGRVSHDSGEIIYRDRNIGHLPPHRRSNYITLISQDRGVGLPRALTVMEMMKLCLEARSFPHQKNMRNDIKGRLEHVAIGFSKVIDSQIWHLSGGEYQLLNLVVAEVLCSNNQSYHFLLLDEHVSQLAPIARDRVLLATERIIEENQLTAIISTHSEHIASSIGNRQIILKQGRVAFDLTGEDFLDDAAQILDLLT